MVTRILIHGETVHHRYYTVWPMFFYIKKYPSVSIAHKERYEMFNDAQRKADRQDFWKLQGNILGSIS